MGRYTKSWTDHWGDTYSVDDDNMADWIDDYTTASYDSTNNEITITGITTLDPDDSDDITETDDVAVYVLANRAITLNADDLAALRLVGSRGGVHLVMLNCTVNFILALEDTNNCALGYAESRQNNFGDSGLDIVHRRSIFTDAGVLRPKENVNTFNLINTAIINSHERDGSSRHSLLLSTFNDSYFAATNGYSYRFSIVIQGGSDMIDAEFNLANSDGTDTIIGACAPGNSLRNVSGLVLQRVNYYNANGADQRVRELGASDNYGSTEAPALISAAGDNGNSNLLVSPRFQIYDTAAALVADNVGCIFRKNGNTTFPTGKQILAASYYPRVYTSGLLDENRADVQMTMTTNVDFDGDQLLDIQVLSTAAEYSYTTNSDGFFDGSFDPAIGDLSASVAFDADRPFDIPLRALQGTSDNDDYNISPGGSGRSFFHTVENFDTTIQIVSLFGTTAQDERFTWDTTNVNVDFFDSGHYIRRLDSNIVDPDDPHMEDYFSAPDITDQFSATGTPSANDVYALYKYAVQEGDIDFDDYPYPNVSGSVFDAHDAATNVLILDTSVTNYSVSDEGTQFSIQALNLIGDDSQTLDELVFATIDLGGGYVDGLNIGADTISDPLTFTSVQSDPEDSFSFKDCTLGSTADGSATIQVSAPDGDTVYLHLHNVSGNATITRASGGTGDIVVLASGDSTPTLGLTDPNVSELVLLDVTINNASGGLLSIFDADDFSLPIYSEASNTASLDSSAVTELTSGNALVVVWSGAGSCLLYTSPSPRDRTRSRMPSSA